MTRLLKADLGRYAGGSTFEFLRSDWAPRIERYLTLRDAPVDALIGQARAFYAGKTQVHLDLRPGTLQVRADGDRTLAKVTLRLQWSRPTPASWGNRPWTEQTDTKTISHDKGATIDRDVDVRANAAFDPSGHLVSYDEDDGIVPARVRVTNPTPAYDVPPADTSDAPEPPALKVGTILDDLGEVFAESEDSGMQQQVTFRHVKHDGKDVWVQDSFTFVSNGRPMGASSLEVVK